MALKFSFLLVLNLVQSKFKPSPTSQPLSFSLSHSSLSICIFFLLVSNWFHILVRHFLPFSSFIILGMENSDQKQQQRHEQHILLPQQLQRQQQKQGHSDDHVCRERAQVQPKSKVNTLVNREVDQEVKLAATAISLNVRLRSSSNMPHHMQDRALRLTRSLIDSAAAAAKALSSKPRPNPTHLARALKKEFDSLYGPAWHCVVGKSFGSFVTHSPGGFLYFSIDSLSVLLFKTEVQVVTEQQPQKPANLGA